MDSNKPRRRAQDDIERDLGFLVHDVARLLRRDFDRRVRRLGITRAQWFVAAYLQRKDGQRQSELALELDMEVGPLGKLLDRLETGGWVKRVTDKTDRRSTRVYKTSRIDPMLADLRREADALYASALADLPAAQRAQLIDMLTNVRGRLIEIDNATSGATDQGSGR